MSDERSVLRAEDVVKRFGAVVALDRVTLDVRRGECVALIGESGSGKTTLLRCFNRLTDPDAGPGAGGWEERGVARSDRAAAPDRVRAPGRRTAAPLAGAAQRRAGALARVASPSPRPAPTGRFGWSASSLAAVRRSLAGRAVRRPAPAHRGGAGPRRGARRGAPRRAVRRARRDHPRRPAEHLPRGSRGARAHGAAGDPRSLRGIPPGRPGRGDARAARIEQVAPPKELQAAPATPYVEALLRRRTGAGRDRASVSPFCSRSRRPARRAGRGRLQAVRRVVSARRDVRAAARGARVPGGAAARARRDRDRLPRAPRGRDRRLSRIHRHRAARDSGRAARARSARGVRPGVARVSRALGRPLAAAARLREHLRHRGAAGDRGAAWSSPRSATWRG